MKALSEFVGIASSSRQVGGQTVIGKHKDGELELALRY